MIGIHHREEGEILRYGINYLTKSGSTKLQIILCLPLFIIPTMSYFDYCSHNFVFGKRIFKLAIAFRIRSIDGYYWWNSKIKIAIPNNYFRRKYIFYYQTWLSPIGNQELIISRKELMKSV